MTLAVNIAQGGANNVTMRNRIINGAMVVSQRNGTSSVTINSAAWTYTVDRFCCLGQGSDGVYTVQQSSTAPAGFVNSLLITVTTADSSIGAGQIYTLRQTIEGYNIADLNWGSANSQPTTLSFWVRSSVTGTFSGCLNNEGTASYPFTYTINSANTWEQKTITVTGPTSGTWGSTNSNGIRITWSLGVGTTYSGTANTWNYSTEYFAASSTTNLIATNGATFYITGVQLEAGTTASPFEYRQYGTELALCQRYYEVIGTIALTSVTTNYQPVYWASQKRAAPTVTTSAATGTFAAFSATTLVSYTGAYQGSPNSTDVNVTVTGSAEL